MNESYDRNSSSNTISSGNSSIISSGNGFISVSSTTDILTTNLARNVTSIETVDLDVIFSDEINPLSNVSCNGNIIENSEISSSVMSNSVIGVSSNVIGAVQTNSIGATSTQSNFVGGLGSNSVGYGIPNGSIGEKGPLTR